MDASEIKFWHLMGYLAAFVLGMLASGRVGDWLIRRWRNRPSGSRVPVVDGDAEAAGQNEEVTLLEKSVLRDGLAEKGQ